jgi:hypothetical protein
MILLCDSQAVWCYRVAVTQVWYHFVTVRQARCHFVTVRQVCSHFMTVWHVWYWHVIEQHCFNLHDKDSLPFTQRPYMQKPVECLGRVRCTAGAR